MRSSVVALLGVVSAGLVVGVLLSVQSTPVDSVSGECEALEQEIKANQSFNGSLQCYPPGVIDVNLSEQIDQRTELQCVCRNVYRGEERVFPVTRSRGP
ncbi:hypothetical protein GLU01_00220 [Nanohaloarchaea archaeon]|jgi:hypothetical protein|nr:hypothetical protein [Candidatus Nanohaloarchaea archaeon]